MYSKQTGKQLALMDAMYAAGNLTAKEYLGAVKIMHCKDATEQRALMDALYAAGNMTAEEYCGAVKIMCAV